MPGTTETRQRWLVRSQDGGFDGRKEAPGFGEPTRTSGVEKVTMLYPDLAVVLARIIHELPL